MTCTTPEETDISAQNGKLPREAAGAARGVIDLPILGDDFYFAIVLKNVTYGNYSTYHKRYEIS